LPGWKGRLYIGGEISQGSV
jgi:hypothetical protein